jgi:antitoxin PrlF
MQVTSRLTSKAQTTVPRAVRDRLGLRPGDGLVWELDGEVRVRRQEPIEAGYLRAVETTLGEWASEDDAAAYDRL